MNVLVTMTSGRQHVLDLAALGFTPEQQKPDDLEPALCTLQSSLDSAFTIRGAAIDTHRIESVEVDPAWKADRDRAAYYERDRERARLAREVTS